MQFLLMMKGMRCPIHHVELVCPLCEAAARGRKGGQARSEAKQRAADRRTRQQYNTARIYLLTDCYASFVAAGAEIILTAAELVARAAAAKREHARRVVYERVKRLKAQGKIVSAGYGKYRLAK